MHTQNEFHLIQLDLLLIEHAQISMANFISRLLDSWSVLRLIVEVLRIENCTYNIKALLCQTRDLSSPSFCFQQAELF